MERKYPAFAVDQVTPLRNLDYFHYVYRQLELAQLRIWVSVFIIEVSRSDDPYLEVRGLIHRLADAARVGIDVRVLSGRTDELMSVNQTNWISHKFMATKGISVSAYASKKRSGNHNKYLVIDEELVIVGSHNWTHQAFRENEEDSLAVVSRDLNKKMTSEFLEDWQDSVVASRARSEARR